MDHRNMVYTIE